MDTKRLLTTILLVGAMMLLLQFLFRGGGAGGGGGTAMLPYPIYASIPELPQARQDNAEPQLITLGSADKASSDKLAVTVNTVTAAIEKVQLNIKDYAQTVERKEPLTLLVAQPGLARPFATLGIHITVGNSAKELPYGSGVTKDSSAEEISKANATCILDRQFVWKAEPRGKPSDDLVLFMSFQDGTTPIAELRKIFHVDPASYEIRITHAVTNLAREPIKVRIDQLAACDLPRESEQGDDRFFFAMGLDSTKRLLDAKRFNVTQVETPKFEGGTREIGQMKDYNNNPVLWVATSNLFFAAITRPLPSFTVLPGAGGAPSSQPAAPRFELNDKTTIPQVDHIASANVDLMKVSTDYTANVPIIRLTGAALPIPADATLNEPLGVFLGPKDHRVLSGSFEAPVASMEYEHKIYQYAATIQYAQGCYSYCVSDVVVQPILWLLDFFKRTVAVGNYGIAIMILVIVIRAALHPLTRSSQINMAVMGKKMKDIAPQVEAAKKRYANNKQKQNEEMMRIYRENKVNPAGGLLGCLPMLIQMPIWAALYSGLRTDIDLRHASFIPGWINDLSAPDTIWPSAVTVIGHPLFRLPLLGWDIYGLNLLPLLLAVVFYLQMKVTTASQPKPADEQQAQMQKMSQYMIFMFPLFLYSAPSGLNLYIFASTMGGLVDTYFVRKTLKKKGILPSTAETLPTHEQK